MLAYISDHGLDARGLYYLKLITSQLETSWKPGEEVPGRSNGAFGGETDPLLAAIHKRDQQAEDKFPRWIAELYEPPEAAN
jgi:hypothetical protein